MKQLFLLAAMVILFAGCNNGQTNTKSDQKMKKLSTLEWAGAVYAVYEDSYNQLDALLGQKPAYTPKLKEDAKAIKASVIEKLIPYGKMRAEWSEADQQKSSDQLSAKMFDISRNPAWMRVGNEARMYYAKEDPELATLLNSMNIITQYAQFELLKKQEPVEAERLGIQ
jgi:hypothetical protein